ncbi:tail fiber domain-containing protein [Enterobacter asburiae]|uniref:tail fiber domain-containing protein n=1 Tax=Enterobacter asburiae TaxID=61645 RepID=UPI00188204C2|nr:tail fiber domain-containing protein [Enterobacter asburiae]MBE8905942.1 tail fiber domain-containing protein [Enterobacter asburiae]
MSAGTLTLTNGSAIVGGSGTAFATELSAGDFIVSTVGGVPYTLPVKTVDSDTQLILVSNFTGPTQSGAAWSAVPRVALNMVTAALVAQSAEALRGLNYDKQNWQQVFSSTGTITVRLPDGRTYSGPSWKGISDTLDGKVDKNSLGNAASLDVGTTEKTVAAGNDSRLDTVNGKSGGTVTGDMMVTQGSRIGVSTQAGGNKNIQLYNTTGDGSVGNYVNYIAGGWYNGSWTLGGVRGNGSDLDRVQLNVNSGVGTAGSFIFYPSEKLQLASCGATGEQYGGPWSTIINWNRNISFYRHGLAAPNDGGFVPFGRWDSYCSGGYQSTAGIGSLSTGPSGWADIVLTTLGDSGNTGQRIFQFSTGSGDIYSTGGGYITGNYIFQKQPNCDITLKHDVKYDDGYQSYENIRKFLPATYVYNDDPRERVRRGVIAQDVMKIDSEYVKLVPAAPKFDSEGNRVDADDTLALDNNVIMLDTVLALNYVIKQLETTQKELQELKLKIAES